MNQPMDSMDDLKLEPADSGSGKGQPDRGSLQWRPTSILQTYCNPLSGDTSPTSPLCLFLEVVDSWIEKPERNSPAILEEVAPLTVMRLPLHPTLIDPSSLQRYPAGLF